jgi:hypothetical protein
MVAGYESYQYETIRAPRPCGPSMVLAPAFCIGPFVRNLELMNILSSSGFSGVISRSYKHSRTSHPGIERAPRK